MAMSVEFATLAVKNTLGDRHDPGCETLFSPAANEFNNILVLASIAEPE